MRTGNHRRWLAGLLLLCGASLSTRWALGPAPAVQELRQRTSFFRTRFPLRLTHPGTYRLMSDLSVQGRDTDAIQMRNTIRRSGRNGLLLGMFGTVEENEVQGSQEAGIMTYGKSNRVIKNTVKENQGPGAKLGGPDNYIARNIFQSNTAGALAATADDSLGHDQEANVFLLPSGEVDETGITRRSERVGDAWSQ